MDRKARPVPSPHRHSDPSKVVWDYYHGCSLRLCIEFVYLPFIVNTAKVYASDQNSIYYSLPVSRVACVSHGVPGSLSGEPIGVSTGAVMKLLAMRR